MRWAVLIRYDVKPRSPRSPLVFPEPDFVLEIEWMVRRGAVVEIDLRKIGPAGPVKDRPGLADRIGQGIRSPESNLRDDGVALDSVRQIRGVDQIAGSVGSEAPCFPVDGGNGDHRQRPARVFQKRQQFLDILRRVDLPQVRRNGPSLREETAAEQRIDQRQVCL